MYFKIHLLYFVNNHVCNLETSLHVADKIPSDVKLNILAIFITDSFPKRRRNACKITLGFELFSTVKLSIVMYNARLSKCQKSEL